jgi:hypothetical protein
MAKQAARRKPGTKRDAAWPEAANASDQAADDSAAAVRPRATSGAVAFSSIVATRPRKRSARSAAIDTERNAAIAMGEALTASFKDAVQAAVREAHAEDLAVPVRVGGIAVEIRPDGKVVPIDDGAAWSPVDWQKAATR